MKNRADSVLMTGKSQLVNMFISVPFFVFFKNATFLLWKIAQICTLISKCDITLLSSVDKDCVEALKGALYTVKQEGTKEGIVYVWSP